MASALFDLAGFLLPDNPGKTRRASFQAAGFYTIVLGALGAFGAVASGLVMSQGHLWVAAASRVTMLSLAGVRPIDRLAVWRLVVRDRASSLGFKIYLAGSMLTAILMAATGYWVESCC